MTITLTPLQHLDIQQAIEIAKKQCIASDNWKTMKQDCFGFMYEDLCKYQEKRQEMNDLFEKNNVGKRRCKVCHSYDMGNELCNLCGAINPGFNSWGAH